MKIAAANDPLAGDTHQHQIGEGHEGEDLSWGHVKFHHKQVPHLFEKGEDDSDHLTFLFDSESDIAKRAAEISARGLERAAEQAAEKGGRGLEKAAEQAGKGAEKAAEQAGKGAEQAAEQAGKGAEQAGKGPKDK